MSRAARPRVVPPETGAGRPVIRVIVPCYGYGHLLEGCVRTVLGQEGVDVRVLIVDDRSPDLARDVGEMLAAVDPRVEYRRHEVHVGLIATANEGLEWAAGDHVVLLSADDHLAPGALRRAADVLERHPDVGMVYGPAPRYREGGPYPELAGRWRGTSLWRGEDWIDVRCRSGHNCISSPEVVVRGSVAERVGGYDPGCTHASDLNMWLRIAAVSDIAFVRGIPQAVYRVHGGSMLRSGHTPLRDLQERRKAFDSFFASSGPLLTDAEGLRRRAGRTLARQALWRASRAVDRGLLDGPDAVPVDELVDFATAVCDDVRRLPEWRGLQLRRRIGAGRSRYFPPFVATGAAHRLRWHASTIIGARTGV